MAETMVLDFDNGGAEVTIDETGLPRHRDAIEVSADRDPDRFNAVTAKALATDEPEQDITIDGPPDGSVHLLAGFIDASGTRRTDVEVRELRGRDEETLARAYATGDMSRFIDAIVRAGVIRLGDVEEPRELQKALDTLLVGDRDLLVMQVRRLAYGDTQRLDVRCPFCENAFEVDYSYSNDVPLKQFDVEDRSQRLFDVECPSGAVVDLRLVDGRAQKIIYGSENSKKTVAELNTLLLTEVIANIDGRPVKGVGPVLDMPARDRAHLLEWLVEHQPGPQYEDVKQECTDCMREFPLVMTVGQMFRPS